VKRKKMKTSCGRGDSARMKCMRGCGGAYGAVWRYLHLAGSWSQTVGFVLVRLAENWLQTIWRFLTFPLQRHFISFILNTICKDNVAINRTVQHMNGLFPSVMTSKHRSSGRIAWKEQTATDRLAKM
jgi:hypothetical protein